MSDLENSGTPLTSQTQPERSSPPSELSRAVLILSAAISCVATVAVAVIGGCTLWFDRDDRIEDKLDSLSETVSSLNKTVSSLDATLRGEAGLSSRVVRLENHLMQVRGSIAPSRPGPPTPDLPPQPESHQVAQLDAVEEPDAYGPGPRQKHVNPEEIPTSTR